MRRAFRRVLSRALLLGLLTAALGGSAASRPAAATASGYQPTAYANVQVRSLPQPDAPAAASIYLRPGSPLPDTRGARPPRQRTVRYGPAPAGGVTVFVDPAAWPYERAEKSPDGRVRAVCTRPGCDHTHHGQEGE